MRRWTKRDTEAVDLIVSLLHDLPVLVHVAHEAGIEPGWLERDMTPRTQVYIIWREAIKRKRVNKVLGAVADWYPERRDELEALMEQ